MTPEAKRATFRALHETGCFVLPNPWDVGSAKLLQHLGFKALASSSAGFAWTMGKPDHLVTRDEIVAHLAALSAAVDLPVNADFESGFAAEPDGVAESVTLALAAGVAGLSIEDLDESGGFYDTARAVERLRAAKAAMAGGDAVLVARTELMLTDPGALHPAIDRLVAFADAGADCLFAPGVKTPDDIATMVRAVAPKPLNVLVLDPALTLAQLADLGVRRVSVGGALARVALGALLTAAEAMADGSFAGLSGGAPRDLLNGVYAP